MSPSTPRWPDSVPRPTVAELVVAALSGVAGVAGGYLTVGWSPQFVAALSERVIRTLSPNFVVAFAIDDLGNLGHTLLAASAVGLSIALLAGIALGGLLVGRWLDRPYSPPGLAGLVTVAVVAPVLGVVSAVGTAAPVVVVLALTAIRPANHEPVTDTRRTFVKVAVGALTVGAVQYVLGDRNNPAQPKELELPDSETTGQSGAANESTGAAGDGSSEDQSDGTGASGEPEAYRRRSVEELKSMAAERELDVAGIPGLVSEIGGHYEVDYSNFDPDVDRSKWALRVTGEVENEVTTTWEDLIDRPRENRFVSLRCVGEPLNGHKLDTAIWTGTPIKPLLDEAVPNGDCECVRLRAADDYYQVFPLAALERGFLAYGMNGMEVPRGHGYPVRALIPGHWGEINVKWLTEIEVLDQEAKGYWEERGWHGTGPVNTVAKIWTVNELGGGRVQVGGHAYAGTRGVDRVEVSTDGGDTWTEATISDPLPAEDVWRQWEHTFEASGKHEVVARAVDGTGTVQPQERADSFPSGATGWVTKTVRA